MKWISVNHFLPSNEDYVLVVKQAKNGNRDIQIGYCLFNGHVPERWITRGTAEVTHWMPLPKLPELSEDGGQS